MNITSQLEQLDSDGVIVTLNWTQQSTFLSYHTSVFPNLATTDLHTEVTGVQLKVLYNIRYNVTIEASHLCGKYSLMTIIALYYSKYCVKLHEHHASLFVYSKFNNDCNRQAASKPPLLLLCKLFLCSCFYGLFNYTTRVSSRGRGSFPPKHPALIEKEENKNEREEKKEKRERERERERESQSESERETVREMGERIHSP